MENVESKMKKMKNEKQRMKNEKWRMKNGEKKNATDSFLDFLISHFLIFLFS